MTIGSMRLIFAATLLLLSCKKEEEPPKSTAPPVATDSGLSSLAIETPDFFPGQPIPKKFTCDGEDLSPEVKWSKAPPATKSYALFVDDPDAPTGTFTHWVIFDMVVPSTHVPEAAKGIGTQAKNDFGNAKWNGPCPPPGKEHRYFFHLYALDVEDLGLKDGVSRFEVEKKMDGHVVGKVETMGTYRR